MVYSKCINVHTSGHSTATALVVMTDQWLGRGNIGGALFIDFSAAFHLVDHKTF